jgi:hypothetical protein
MRRRILIALWLTLAACAAPTAPQPAPSRACWLTVPVGAVGTISLHYKVCPDSSLLNGLYPNGYTVRPG